MKKGTNHIVTPTLVELKSLANGDFFRRNIKGEQGKTTYTAEGYCRENKKYTGTDYSDMNRQIYLKGDTMVWVGFEF